jgi:hypothetical protein
MSEQRRGRRIAMSPDERDSFLGEQRTCRVSTVGATGLPHTSALWFVWDGAALWLYSLVRSQRWANLARDPRISVLVDTGEDYSELRGVQLTGSVQRVGEAPRLGEPVPELNAVETQYAAKYGQGTFEPDGAHAWLQLTPAKVVSWDFRKIGR